MNLRLSPWRSVPETNSEASPADCKGVGPPGKAGSTPAMPLHDAVQVLSAAEAERAGYQRTSFTHWVDADRDGCNTRNEVGKKM